MVAKKSSDSMKKIDDNGLPLWNLSVFYNGIDDVQIMRDVDRVVGLARKFYSFKGRLDKCLEDALKVDIEISELESKIFVYFALLLATHAGDEKITKAQSVVDEKISKEVSPLTAYASIEIGALSDGDYIAQLAESELLQKHRPSLDYTRLLAKHNLTEDVEIALSKRSPFGVGVWDDVMDELDTKIKFRNPIRNWKNLFGLSDEKFISFQKILHILGNNRSASVRNRAMKIINDTLKNPSSDVGGFSYAEMRAKSLNALIGAKIVSDEDRKFKYAMESRNIGNMVDVKTVDALHDAVATLGAQQARRYYKIVARLLGKKILKWSDRNAPMPFSSGEKIAWGDGLKMVRDSYERFSPTMAALFDEIVAKEHVDAGVYAGKTTGAFSYSFVVPKNQAETFVFMSYQNSVRDVMTLAHEMGHSIHGLLSGRAQGVLMNDAPMAYAETASIFGEMLTFQNLLSRAKTDREKLLLLLEKCGDFMNTVVRQISFSILEQKMHAARVDGKISVEDFNKFWRDVTQDFYGAEGDVFDYADIDSLWSYIGHFMRPFYVYAYAFGELFTQSLFAVRKNFTAKKFENLYLDMLKSGNTKDAVALMKPFDLNPNDANFWKNGIDCSVKKWLDEVEILIEKLGM